MKIEQQNGLQMLLNDENKVVFPPIATQIIDIGENMYAVKINESYGVINRAGKTVIPIKFDKCAQFSHGLVVMELEQSFMVFNTKGVLIYKDSHVDRLSDFDGEYLYATNYDEDEFTHERQTAFGKIKIDSIDTPMANYEYNKRFEKSTNANKQNNANESYYQPSIFDL